jgi:hypothetical protein
MKTLIIHPTDPSTSFLDIVYKDIPNQTLITGGISKNEVRKLIKKHDRVMMMGHGSPYGLFAVGQFTNQTKWGPSYIIDNTMVDVLSEKEHNVYIWCWASDFVRTNDLKGFSSGMFISEVGEAMFCSNEKTNNSELSIQLKTTTQDEVDESNYGFCNIINKYINETTDTIYENVMKEYGMIAEHNPVALYNHNRIKMFM